MNFGMPFVLAGLMLAGGAGTAAGPRGLSPQENAPPILKAPSSPEIFLPGIVSTGLNEAGVTFSADGRECLFGVTLNRIETICLTRSVGGSWTAPEVAPFSGRWSDGFPCFQPGGSRLFFHSNRPLPDGAKYNIWFVDRTDVGWSEPRPVGPPINGDRIAVCPSVSRTGTVYFSRQFDDGRELIFRSRLLGGRYQEPEELPAAVNTQKAQFHAVVAPDESCLVMPLSGRGDALGAGHNYYVSFRDERDQWSGWINLGKDINERTIGGVASFSPDGKAFFFSAFPPSDATPSYDRPVSYAELQSLSIRNPAQYRWDVFWIDAGFIGELRKTARAKEGGS